MLVERLGQRPEHLRRHTGLKRDLAHLGGKAFVKIAALGQLDLVSIGLFGTADRLVEILERFGRVAFLWQHDLVTGEEPAFQLAGLFHQIGNAAVFLVFQPGLVGQGLPLGRLVR